MKYLWRVYDSDKYIYTSIGYDYYYECSTGHLQKWKTDITIGNYCAYEMYINCNLSVGTVDEIVDILMCENISYIEIYVNAKCQK